jgi:hypothetical protein
MYTTSGRQLQRSSCAAAACTIVMVHCCCKVQHEAHRLSKDQFTLALEFRVSSKQTYWCWATLPACQLLQLAAGTEGCVYHMHGCRRSTQR